MSLKNINSLFLIGAGKMGMAMARGWLKSDLKPSSLTLIDPKPQQSTIDFAAKHKISILPNMPDIDAQIVVLAVKPQIMEQVLNSIKPYIKPDVLVLSIAGGIKLENLSKTLGSKKIIRAMPNTPAQVGQGVTGAVKADGVSKSDIKIANALMQASGDVHWFDNEDDLDALTFVSGCGPAYVFLLAEAMAQAGVEQGLEEEKAKILARQTVIGAAALMQDDASDAAILRKNVTSPGGITEAALSVLMADDGFSSLFSRAFKKAAKRNEELGS